MSRTSYDVAVVGLGALGIHAARELALQGLSVVGLEQSEGGTEHGASGGRTRIFRTVYSFGGEYVPALQRAKEHWDNLARRVPGTRHETGALHIGSETDPETLKAFESASDRNLDHTVLTESELCERWPQHRMFSSDIALYDPTGALLIPPMIISSVAKDAREAGADLFYSAAVASVETEKVGFRVEFINGGALFAKHVVFATGAWTSRFVPRFADETKLKRAMLYWYETVGSDMFTPEAFPVGLRRSGNTRYSFFPQVDEYGMKVNFHVPKASALRPDGVDDSLPNNFNDLEMRLCHSMDGLGACTRRAAYVESYTLDYRPLLGEVPGMPGAWILAGGSGQSFKLAPVLAEGLAARVVGRCPMLSLQGVARQLNEAPEAAVIGP